MYSDINVQEFSPDDNLCLERLNYSSVRVDFLEECTRTKLKHYFFFTRRCFKQKNPFRAELFRKSSFFKL